MWYWKHGLSSCGTGSPDCPDVVLEARIILMWYWKHGLSMCGTESTDYPDVVLEERIIQMR